MIVKTRYRDIPWSELRKNLILSKTRLRKLKWETMRGKRIRILTPASGKDINAARCHCRGFIFLVVDKRGKVKQNKDGRQVAVCPHIAEIGD